MTSNKSLRRHWRKSPPKGIEPDANQKQLFGGNMAKKAVRLTRLEQRCIESYVQSCKPALESGNLTASQAADILQANGHLSMIAGRGITKNHVYSACKVMEVRIKQATPSERRAFSEIDEIRKSITDLRNAIRGDFSRLVLVVDLLKCQSPVVGEHVPGYDGLVIAARRALKE